MRRATRAGAALAVLALAGCAVPAIEPHRPAIANIQIVRAADLPAIQVGAFALAPGRPASMDRSIQIRASTLRPPKGDSFSKYLADCLATELRAVGKLDTASGVIVDGLLMESRVSSGVGVGEAALAATFTVTRRGAPVYEKTLRVDATWKSEFIGAVAIPDAINQYTALYGKLVGALLADEGFKAAVKGG